MKKVKSVMLILAMGFGLMIVSTSCRQAAKYGDDVIKVVDDKVDDAIKGYKPKPKPGRQVIKDCPNCVNGRAYDPYYNVYYNCSNCGGEGRIWIYE